MNLEDISVYGVQLSGKHGEWQDVSFKIKTDSEEPLTIGDIGQWLVKWHEFDTDPVRIAKNKEAALIWQESATYAEYAERMAELQQKATEQQASAGNAGSLS